MHTEPSPVFKDQEVHWILFIFLFHFVRLFQRFFVGIVVIWTKFYCSCVCNMWVYAILSLKMFKLVQIWRSMPFWRAIDWLMSSSYLTFLASQQATYYANQFAGHEVSVHLQPLKRVLGDPRKLDLRALMEVLLTPARPVAPEISHLKTCAYGHGFSITFGRWELCFLLCSFQIALFWFAYEVPKEWEMFEVDKNS